MPAEWGSHTPVIEAEVTNPYMDKLAMAWVEERARGYSGSERSSNKLKTGGFVVGISALAIALAGAGLLASGTIPPDAINYVKGATSVAGKLWRPGFAVSAFGTVKQSWNENRMGRAFQRAKRL